jgi:hypothetical protein
MIRRTLLQLIALAMLATASFSLRSQPLAAPEYQLKAAFLFNFMQFVQWPASAFADGAGPMASPMIIAVLGEDPFGEQLDQLVRGEKIRGRAIVVQRHARIEDVGPCQLLYINESDQRKLKDILAKLVQQPVLTVSDAPDFTHHGGMINFVTQDNRVRLLINVDAATAAQLTLSSKLLRPAQIVTVGQ